MYLNLGEYIFHIEADMFPNVVSNLKLIYGEAYTSSLDKPVDFYVNLKCDAILRKYIKPQVTLYLGEETPFKPLPKSQAYPVLEWGMNWCIAATDFNHLLIHSAVLVKDNQAIIFPALPGSGKSTLSAYFNNTGWQLFSDEMAIIDTSSLYVKPMFRPVCLKNDSIDIVREWFPKCVMTDVTHDTQKGSVTHLKSGDWQSFSSYQPAKIVAIVFPKYSAKVHESEVYQLSKVEAFQRLSANSFNYNVLGSQGFELLRRIIDSSIQLECNYSNLAEVNEILSREIIS